MKKIFLKIQELIVEDNSLIHKGKLFYGFLKSKTKTFDWNFMYVSENTNSD